MSGILTRYALRMTAEERELRVTIFNIIYRHISHAIYLLFLILDI